MASVIKSDGKINFFAIFQSVGKSLPNKMTDCMLVLYLLWKYAAYSTGRPNDIGIPSFDPNKDFANLKVISSAILGFQKHFNKLTFNPRFFLKEDGKAHCPLDWFGHKNYTIRQINYSYQAAVITFFNNEKDPYHLALEDHGMPTVLRAELISSDVFNGVI